MSTPTVLFVDDDSTVLAALRATFKGTPLNVVLESDPRQARNRLPELRPEVIVADHRMPHMTGVELLEESRSLVSDAFRVLLTGYADVETAMAAVNQGGIHRLLTKPWEVAELRETVLSLAEASAMQRFAGRSLSERGLLQTITALAEAIDAKDPYTRGHSELVSRFGEALAARLGMSEEETDAVRIGGLLHDAGKIGIPERILLKPGRLDDDEFREMKRHPELGARILAPLGILPPLVRDIVLHHHERWDGHGYPHRLSGEEVSAVARVVGVADAYEAMTARRAYRGPQSLRFALGELERCAGTQFDPVIAQVAAEMVDDGSFDAIRTLVSVRPQLAAWGGEAVAGDVQSA